MGLLLAGGYNRIMDVHQEAKRQQEAAGKVHTAEIIEAYKAGGQGSVEAQSDRRSP